jgi:hypothetical protein
MALVRSPKEPQGATYTLSDGSTVTKTGETISSETQYYNVVQVTFSYYSIFPANHMRVAAGVGVAVMVAVLTVC